MWFYQYLTYLVLLIIPFFPLQFDKRIYYVIFGYCIFLLPLFFRELWLRLKRKDLLTYLYLFFLISGIISTYYSFDRWSSFWMLGLYVCSFIVFTVISKIFNNQKSWSILLGLLTTIVLSLSLISLYNTFVLNYINQETEGVGFMWIYLGHNHLGALLVITLPIIAYFIRINWSNLTKRLFYIGILSILVFSLLATFSRGAYISILVASISASFLFKLSSKKILLSVVLVSSIGIIILLSNFSFLSRQVNNERDGFNISTRNTYWQRSLLTGLKHPLIGLGLNTTQHTFRFFPLQKRYKSNYSHNFLLQMFSDAGFLGLISGTLLIGAAFVIAYNRILAAIKNKSSEKYLQIALFTGLLASVVLSMVDYNLQMPTIWILFWLVMGVLLRNSKKVS